MGCVDTMMMRRIISSLVSSLAAITTTTTTTTTTVPKATTTRMMMKAMVYGRTDNNNNNNGVVVQCVEKPIPTLTNAPPNSALIQVVAVGLNPVDAKCVIGDKLSNNKIMSSWMKPWLVRNVVQGKTIGFDFAGRIISCSSSSSSNNNDDNNNNTYQPNDEVFGCMPPFHGSLSEYIVCPLDQLSKKPTSITWEEAAALPLVGLTAYQALQPYCKTQQSQQQERLSSILIVGASGGTGHVAISVARAMMMMEQEECDECDDGSDGSSTMDIVGICSTRNVEFCYQRGATHVIDYTKNNNTTTTVETQVKDYCQTHFKNKKKKKFDIILDCVTSDDERDLQYNYPITLQPYCTRRYIRLGSSSTLDWCKAGMEKVFVRSSSSSLLLPNFFFFGTNKLFWITFPNSSRQLQTLATWIDDDDDEKKMKPPFVSCVFPFTPDKVQEALDLLNARRVQGKLVIRVQPE